MNKERLKLIVKNLELLVEALKSEIYSDVGSYTSKDQEPKLGFYEGRDDDDGYPD